jgi:prepilin-type N-terminal cleavage/methylation domain-containing protein
MRPKAVANGFTLIELMIVVAIMGVLAAIAVPSFTSFVNRSKTAETTGNINSMFKTAASYYAAELTSRGEVASVAGHCIVSDAGPTPVNPGKEKQPFDPDATFRAIGFNIADMVYYSYGIGTGGDGTSVCNNLPGRIDLYTFYAHGDLDGDTIQSTFELAAGSDSSNTLYHSRGFFIVRDSE